MSRFKQYFLLGGLIWIMQIPAVSDFLTSEKLRIVVAVIVFLLLCLAVGLVVWVRKRAVKGKEGTKASKGTYPLL